ncbi:MAG TPA: prolyl oligopeptidase family serine peptidase, partial [Sphingomonas sp.]|nr:prolyl oligopeptidase family serine peptidase [Sphingomonas sp.]
NPERYQRLRNTDKLEGLAGDLMIISAADDVNTPLEQTMAYAEALVGAGVPFAQLIVPNCNHVFVESSGRSRMTYVHRQIAKYFLRTLGAPKPLL